MLFWSEIPTVELSEETNLQWVHALSVGKYSHPTFGELDLNPDRLNKFALSVNEKVRGIDPDIDYDHKMDPSKGKSAAGWVKKAETRADGLWLLVEWTEKAKQSIKDKEYRYFSTEFVKEWANEQGEKFTDVIMGGGLTNRPFLKNLVPVNLSELSDDGKENEMDRAELARILGLSEDATDEDIKTKLGEMQDAPKIDLSKLDVTVNDEGKLVATHPDVEDATWEGDIPSTEAPKNDGAEKELAKLAEDNPTIAAFLAEHTQLKDDVKGLKAVTRLSEVTTQLSELTEDKKALPPVAIDKFRDVMVQMPKQLSDAVADGLKELVKVGLVELGETTPTTQDGKQKKNSNAISVFFAEIDKIKAEHKDDGKKLSTIEATEIIQSKQPHLYNEYVNAVEDGQRLTEEV